jgi:predicted transcriptional regulator
MRTWNDYKEHVKSVNPNRKADIEEMETVAAIIATLIEQRNALGYSQRQLADLCHMPQSSIARIESCKTVPNLETLIRIMKPLGLTLTAQTAQ